VDALVDAVAESGGEGRPQDDRRSNRREA